MTDLDYKNKTPTQPKSWVRVINNLKEIIIDYLKFKFCLMVCGTSALMNSILKNLFIVCKTTLIDYKNNLLVVLDRQQEKELLTICSTKKLNTNRGCNIESLHTRTRMCV